MSAEERLAAIEARAKAARAAHRPGATTVVMGTDEYMTFVAHAGEDIPWLIEQLREARQIIAAGCPSCHQGLE